ncbi:MAG: BatA and WFA domain-containing protein [Bryobacterales bacterium]|nr:BatA and WFA domain-containing protein [Bryobacterales bacterium]MBV9399872.1 BatA and WFA domain-containing protein [Bryobacterales bacterium]
MGFFAPWFLAGLAGLAVPLYLHLLKRQKNPPRPVPSLLFWESRTQSSTRHKRLHYLLLLSLRLAVLALLILGFTNPFINRSAAALASNRLVLLVIDNSFSMRAGTRLAEAKNEAMGVLAGKGGARAQVASFGSQLRLMTQPIEDQGALRAAVQAIQPGDGHGNFGELARAVRGIADSTRAPVELHVFSDMQRTSLAATFSDMALPGNINLIPHPVVTKAQPNWTVESVNAPAQVWGKETKPIRVQAVIAGYGTPAAQRIVSLAANGKTAATKTVAVPANGRATVEFPALDVPYGFSRCEVKIDSADALPADDLRRFAIQRSDPQKALLIHNYGDSRSPLYISTALAAAAQSAFTLESINVNEAADRQASNYAFIILSDVNSVPPLLENSLMGYVRAGGSVLIAAGTSAGARTQVPLFGARILQTRDYSRVPDRYMSVGYSDSSYPAVAKAAGWPGVKFFYALDVDPADARVIVRLGDQTPLLMEKRIGEGRVVLLTSGLDNLTNDFPLNPAFVPFIEQTARYLAGSERRGGAVTVEAYLELRNAKQQAQGVEVTDPEGKRPLTLGEAASAQSFQLTEAGYYQFRFANGQRDEVAVNPDARESNLDVMPEEVISLWQGKGGEAVQEEPSPGQPASSVATQKIPQTLWWYIMVLVLAFAIAESVLASRYLGVQREEQ